MRLPYQPRMIDKTTPFTSPRYIFTNYIEPAMWPKIADLGQHAGSATQSSRMLRPQAGASYRPDVSRSARPWAAPAASSSSSSVS